MSTSPSNQNVGILAAGIWPSLATLRNATAPIVQRFARVLGFPYLLRFVPLDQVDVDNGWTILNPVGGGGAWLADRVNDQGANVAFVANAITLGVYSGPWQVIPSGAVNSTITLDATNAVLGDTKELTRADLSGFTVAVVNGGPAAGTLATFAGSAFGNMLFWFSGTDWTRRR